MTNVLARYVQTQPAPLRRREPDDPSVGGMEIPGGLRRIPHAPDEQLGKVGVPCAGNGDDSRHSEACSQRTDGNRPRRISRRLPLGRVRAQRVPALNRQKW